MGALRTWSGWKHSSHKLASLCVEASHRRSRQINANCKMVNAKCKMIIAECALVGRRSAFFDLQFSFCILQFLDFMYRDECILSTGDFR